MEVLKSITSFLCVVESKESNNHLYEASLLGGPGHPKKEGRHIAVPDPNM